MTSSNAVPEANDDQGHSSMMAWRVQEFGPPNVMRFERVLRPTPHGPTPANPGCPVNRVQGALRESARRTLP
jgi:hypothetical protein